MGADTQNKRIPENIHTNHRERMRKRYMEHGLDNFSDHEVLELLLYYAIPRGDVNPAAHNLLNEFTNLAGVMEASIEDIQSVAGIGPSAAVFLHLLPEVFSRYQTSNLNMMKCNSTQEMAEYLIRYYLGKSNEQLFAILMDNSCRIKKICDIGEQKGASAVRVNTRKLLQYTLQHNAAHVVLAHNHPNGSSVPSREDLIQTTKIKQILSQINVSLVDHIIIGGNDWTSLVHTKQYYPYD